MGGYRYSFLRMGEYGYDPILDGRVWVLPHFGWVGMVTAFFWMVSVNQHRIGLAVWD